MYAALKLLNATYHGTDTDGWDWYAVGLSEQWPLPRVTAVLRRARLGDTYGPHHGVGRVMESAGSGEPLGAKHSAAARRRTAYRSNVAAGIVAEQDLLLRLYGTGLYLLPERGLLETLDAMAHDRWGHGLPSDWQRQRNWWYEQLVAWGKGLEAHDRHISGRIGKLKAARKALSGDSSHVAAWYGQQLIYWHGVQSRLEELSSKPLPGSDPRMACKPPRKTKASGNDNPIPAYTPADSVIVPRRWTYGVPSHSDMATRYRK